MYAAVPMTIPMLVMAGLAIVGDSDRAAAVVAGPDPSSAFARPKSSTFTVPSSRTLMLAGFRSRWTMPCSCAASMRLGDLPGDGDSFVNRDRPLSDPLCQVRTGDELHDQRADRRAVLETVNLRDVGMVERGQRLRFASKTRQAIRIGRE